MLSFLVGLRDILVGICEDLGLTCQPPHQQPNVASLEPGSHLSVPFVSTKICNGQVGLGRQSHPWLG